MNYCIKCGKQNSGSAKFCTGCGVELNVIVKSEQANPASEIKSPSAPAKQVANLNKWIVISIFVLLGAALVYFLIRKTAHKQDTFSRETNTAIIPNTKTESAQNKQSLTSLTESEIISFLNEWLNAQNTHNLIVYADFYANDFEGIKRIKSGQIFYYTHDEWIRDRTKMYNSAKNLIMTVSDTKIILSSGDNAVVNFTHGYSSDQYNDIGEKQLHLLKSHNGKIYITKEEMLNSYDPDTGNATELSYTDNEGKLVFKSDCFVIITGSFTYERDVKTDVRRLKEMGYANAGYLWIPDYPSLSGKPFFAPFIGPFKSYSECETNLRSLAKAGRFWYGLKVSFDARRVEIR